ncbi:MAG: glycosyltransferase [Phycisphaerales bacterium]|nr:glycosyltransferase [Phycisphaerales bacterium]
MHRAKPLRILHVTRTLDAAAGGPPRSSSRLAAALAMQGHNVALTSGGPPASDPRAQDVLRGIPGVDAVDFLPPVPDGLKPWSRDVVDSVTELVDSFDVVALQGFWRPIFRRIAKACTRTNTPYIPTPRGALDPWSLSKKPLKKKLAMMVAFRDVLKRSLFVHALTDFERASVDLLKSGAKCEVIPNGVFPQESVEGDMGPEFIASHPALHGKPFVLFIGRLHHKKGLLELVDAMEVLQRRACPTHLVIAGPDEGMQSRLEQRVWQHRLQETVHFVGPLYGRDKAAALQSAACFCLPSHQEGFSMAVLDALATSTPVIITEACHFPDVPAAGAGIQCSPTPEQLAEAIASIVQRPDDAAAMGAAGRALVLRSYAWPDIADQYAACIRVALDGGPCSMPTTDCSSPGFTVK